MNFNINLGTEYNQALPLEIIWWFSIPLDEKVITDYTIVDNIAVFAIDLTDYPIGFDITIRISQGEDDKIIARETYII